MRALILTLFILTFSLITPPALAQDGRLFQSDEMLNVVLTAPLTQTYNERKKDERLWMVGQLAYKDADGATKRAQVSVRTRGVFRRENCKLPPLHLNFKRKEVKGTLFDGQDKLKLVAPCNTDQQSQQNIVLEYLAYRALEKLTSNALKTRLLRVSYVDSDGKKKPWTHIGFVIEDDKNMARRLGMQIFKTPKLTASQLDGKNAALVDLFQLMIANTDYSIRNGAPGKDCCHNVELLAPNGRTDGVIPVPYDFDSSGLVAAIYAKPSDLLPIKSVRKRYFIGRCRSPEIWAETFAFFDAKRTAILALFSSSPLLDDKSKTRSVEYMNEFFDMITNSKLTDKKVIGRCRD